MRDALQRGERIYTYILIGQYTYTVYTYIEGRCVFIHSIGYSTYCKFWLEVYTSVCIMLNKYDCIYVLLVIYIQVLIRRHIYV